MIEFFGFFHVIIFAIIDKVFIVEKGKTENEEIFGNDS